MIDKSDIKQWAANSNYFLWQEDEDKFVKIADHCFNDLQPQWVSIDKNDNYDELMKAGLCTFWHKVHKCEVTGSIVKNELEEKLLQGNYSVVEKTKTTAWPIASFSFMRAPSLPPK